MLIKILLVIVFFAILVGVGVFSHKQANSVDGFVLGGRNVGPWLTAFAYGTSYFSAVVFVGYAGQFGWKYQALNGAGQEQTKRLYFCLLRIKVSLRFRHPLL